jgi:hypothetical protein
LLLLDDTIQRMPCLLSKQPFFYLISQDSPQRLSIIEIQLFSKSMALVYNLQNQSHQWTISNATKVPVQDRRSNFHGQTLQVVSVYERGYNGTLMGYNGVIAASIVSYFNVTLEFSEISAFGRLSQNGTWNGIVGALINNDLDVCK